MRKNSKQRLTLRVGNFSLKISIGEKIRKGLVYMHDQIQKQLKFDDLYITIKSVPHSIKTKCLNQTRIISLRIHIFAFYFISRK